MAAWVAILVLPPALTVAGAAVVRLPGGQLQIGVDAESGRLVEIVEPASRHNFAQAQKPPALWSLEAVVEGKSRTIEASAARQFSVERDAATPGGLRLSWSDFPEDVAPELRVDVRATRDADGVASRWAIGVTKPRDWVVSQVEFPRWADEAGPPGEFLAVPAWMGELHANPRAALAGAKKAGRRLAWEYPGRLSLQCLTLYREGGPGLYLACDDAAAHRKTFAVRGDGDGHLEFSVMHLPENGARGMASCAPAYGVVIGTFRGDWVTAAERYRAWAERQEWAKQSRLARGLVPAWAEQTALWIWNRGRSEEVLRPAAVMRRELGLPVSVLWHWWHGCPYDTGFPEYLPPREGVAPFRGAMDAAQAAGVHAMVYMNQRLWGVTTPSWRDEGAERFTVRGVDGTYKEEVYNTFTKQACVSMCLGTEFWRTKYAGLAERAVRELAVNGIYMDQACTSLACYDPAHGHPLGGGTYWLNGFQRLAGDIRTRSRDVRPIALAGEGSGEAWLPHLDLMLSLQVSRERYAAPADGVEPIPFFQAVYHPYAIQYGNYSSLTLPPYDELWPREFAPTEPLRLLDRKYSRQFYLEQARSFVWGQQPMLANFREAHLRERPEEIEYVVRLARLRVAARDYLQRGEFLRPPVLDAPMVECELSRLSIYAGQQGGVTTFKRRLPLALAGAWRAPNGCVAVALASIADEPLDLGLRIDRAYYGVTARTELVQLDERGRRSLGQLPEAGAWRVALPPRGACLLELANRRP